MSTELEQAWAAGLFEGEGCITFHQANSVRLSLGMTDFDVVERFVVIVGVGNTHLNCHASRKTPMLYWAIQNKHDVQKTLQFLLPYFGKRRKTKALAALERLGNNRGKGTREQCYHGHEKNGDNLYIDPTTGVSGCRACKHQRYLDRKTVI